MILFLCKRYGVFYFFVSILAVIPLETRRKERMDLEQEASSIVSMYQNETVEQMLRLAQRTLDSLRRRFTVHTLAEDDWLLNFTSGRRKAVKVQPSVSRPLHHLNLCLLYQVCIQYFMFRLNMV